MRVKITGSEQEAHVQCAVHVEQSIVLPFGFELELELELELEFGVRV